jgi:hypothetical protein
MKIVLEKTKKIKKFPAAGERSRKDYMDMPESGQCITSVR